MLVWGFRGFLGFGRLEELLGFQGFWSSGVLGLWGFGVNDRWSKPTHPPFSQAFSGRGV